MTRRSWKHRHRPVPQTRPTLSDLVRRYSEGLNVRREFLRRIPVSAEDAASGAYRVLTSVYGATR